MLGLEKGKVRLVPHQSTWKEEFEEEKNLLVSRLSQLVVAIEHVGSTAIPGVSAKPIIDIDIGVDSLHAVRDVADKLPSLGYREVKHMEEPDIHIVFAKGSKEIGTTRYLHLVRYGGPVWNHDLLFRDYLRENVERAQEYETLKRELATRYSDDRMAYTDGKKKFIEETVALADKT